MRRGRYWSERLTALAQRDFERHGWVASTIVLTTSQAVRAIFIVIDVGYHRGAVIRILYAAAIALFAWSLPRVVKRFGTHLTLRSRVLFIALGVAIGMMYVTSGY